jgi:hypothetical protein
MTNSGLAQQLQHALYSVQARQFFLTGAEKAVMATAPNDEGLSVSQIEGGHYPSSLWLQTA